MDLLSDSSSRGSSSSSISNINTNLVYNSSPSLTTTFSSQMTKEPNYVDEQSSLQIQETDDEACFVDPQQKRIDTIALLPSELAVYILSLLPCHTDVFNCKLVSRAWYPLCHDSQIWKALFERKAEYGWNVIGNVEETWREILKLDSIEQHDILNIPFTPTRRRGKAVLVDEDPLLYRSEGDVSMQSVGSDMTRVSLHSEQGIEYRINWYAIYQARFSLTHRWSLRNSEPEPATMDISMPVTSSAITGNANISPHGNGTIDERGRSFTLKEKLLQGHTDSIYCIRFDHRSFKLPEEIEKGLQQDARNGPLYDPRTSLGIGSYGKILSGSRDRTIKVWDGDSGICLHTLQGHKGSVLCLEYDDDFLFTGSSDETVVVWNFGLMRMGTTPTILKRLRGHRSPILDLKINEDWLATCGKDYTVRIYNRNQDYQMTRIYTSHNGPVNAIELTRSLVDGKTRAMTVSGERGAHLWDVETGTLIRQFTGQENGLACVKLLDNLVVAGSNDMTIRVWNAETGQSLCICKQHEGLVRAIGFDPRRKLILSGGYDGKIKLFYVGRELHPDAVLPSEGSISHPFWEFESQGKTRVFDVQMDVTRILSCGEDVNICVCDFGQGDPLMRLFT